MAGADIYASTAFPEKQRTCQKRGLEGRFARQDDKRTQAWDLQIFFSSSTVTFVAVGSSHCRHFALHRRFFHTRWLCWRQDALAFEWKRAAAI
jgi:hypothetical protein